MVPCAVERNASAAVKKRWKMAVVGRRRAREAKSSEPSSSWGTEQRIESMRRWRGFHLQPLEGGGGGREGER